MLTRSELNNLKRLEAAATIPPWNFSSRSGLITQTAHFTRDVWVIPRSEADCELIAALRNAAPALIAMAEESLPKPVRVWRDPDANIYWALVDNVLYAKVRNDEWNKAHAKLSNLEHDSIPELSPTESAAFLEKHPIPSEVKNG